jgi:hypothetical protein
MDAAAAAAAAKAARAAEDNSTIMISVICVVWGLSLITACARFYTRAVLVRSFAKDDIFMVFAVVSRRRTVGRPPQMANESASRFSG